MKITIALLLLLFTVPIHIFGRANPSPIQGPDPVPERITKQPIQISDEFREVAGNAFDKVQALQAAQLKGKLLYKPVLHEADLSVIRTHRKASNEAEKGLAYRIENLKLEIEIYRAETEKFHSCQGAGTTCGSITVAGIKSDEKGQERSIEVISELLKKL
jgi:hypothetical protein